MAALKFPDDVVKGLVNVATLDDERLREISAILNANAEQVKAPDFPDRLAEQAKSIDRDTALSVFTAILALYILWAHSPNSTVSSIAEDVAQTIGAQDLPSQQVDQERLKTRIETLMSVPSLEGATKALFIIREHHSVFTGARVFTDVRSIFGDDVSKPPLAAVIIHNLKIRYRESGKSKDIQLALDRDDLKALIKTLERAELKDATIRRVLADAKLTHVDT